MRPSRSIVAVVSMAVMLVACSGTPAATPGESDDDGGGGSATIAPIETTSGGDTGNSGGGSGQIHIDIGGPLQVTVDLPFFSFGSRFEGDVAGVQLNFATDGGSGIASITGVPGSAPVIGYVGDEGSANVQTCQLTDWTIGATSASGSFDCTDGFGTLPDGTYLTGITMQGSSVASQ